MTSLLFILIRSSWLLPFGLGTLAAAGLTALQQVWQRLRGWRGADGLRICCCLFQGCSRLLKLVDFSGHWLNTLVDSANHGDSLHHHVWGVN